jgi:hypothetical protein
MNRSYLVGFVPLFLITSAQSVAADWDQAHNDLSAFLGVQSNTNLFNTAMQRQSDQSGTAGIRWDWLGLFEGYGLQLPLQINRQQYRDSSDLAQTLYQLQPELRLFLTQQTDLSLQATLRKDQHLAGDSAAEFLSAAERALIAKQTGAQAALSFGRAPDIQNLRVTLGTDRRQQDVQEQRYSTLDSDFAEAQYSHKLNENVALVLDVARRQEQQNQLSTDLTQYGGGLAVQWTGQQFFRLTGGRFSRSYAADELAKVTGSYWQLENVWQFDQRWQLQLQSGRNSVLSYATGSVSQLDTRHAASMRWQYDQSHQFSIELSQLTSRLDQDDYHRTRDALGAGWRWQWAQQWQSLVQLSQVRQRQQQQLNRDRVELMAEVSWSW